MNAKDVCFDSRHRKDLNELNEMRCHALRKMWTTIPSADAHFAGPVT